MGNKQYNINLSLTADTSKAKKNLESLQKQLTSILTTPSHHRKFNLGIDEEVKEASLAVATLKQQLKNATSVNTGKLDLTKFNQQLKASGMSIEKYKDALLTMGPSGASAFSKLSQSILTAEIPLKRSNKLLHEFAETLKNTMRWQLSSTILNGFMTSVSAAYGYAQDLNRSLNDIRIVTGASVEEMDKFAQKANKAAVALSTTTNQYAKASLIYYQQGLKGEEVEERTNVTIKLANAAGISAQTASDQLTAIWNNFDDGSKSLEHYANVLTKLGAETASSSDEISQGLEKFAAVGNTIGLSYENAAAALATVTATTRQSADTVGTAFKTIFARIQGLNLGDTLDDGTTLNKYSQALAKVGISIKDQFGELKSMDVLLDEMGQKWKTLNKDQQVGLAQTVAGVRQYAQLTALMENYDFYQENLFSAQNSEGALQEQADIYAESWEAASNRVRASLEEIYEKIFDDKFFISLLNVIEKITNSVSEVIDTVGGLKGVVTALGVVLLKTFSSDMAKGVGDFRYSIMGMTKIGRAAKEKEISDLRKETSEQLRNLFGEAENGGVNFAIVQAYTSQAEAQDKLIRKSKDLNDTQKAIAGILMDQHDTLVQKVTKQAQYVELLEDENRTLERNINARGKDKQRETEANSYMKGQKGYSALQTVFDKSLNVPKPSSPGADDTKKLQQVVKQVEQLNKAFKGNDEDLEKMSAATSELTKRLKEYNVQASKFKNASDDAGREEALNNIQKLRGEIENLTGVTGKSSAEIETTFGPEGAGALINFMGKVSSATKDGVTDFDKVRGAVRELEENLKSYNTVVDQSGKKLTKIVSAEDIAALEKAGEGMGSLVSNLIDLQGATEGLEENLDRLPNVTSNFDEGLVQTIAALSSFGLALNEVGGIIDTFRDGENNIFEDFMASVVVIIPLLLSFKSLLSNTSLMQISHFTSMIPLLKAIKFEIGATGKLVVAGTQELATWQMILKSTLVPLLLISGAIALIALGIKEAYEDFHHADLVVEEAGEKARECGDRFAESAQQAKEFKDSLGGYESAKKELDNLSASAEGYGSALKKVNEEARELIENNNLIKGTDWKYSDSGEIEFIKDENGSTALDRKQSALDRGAYLAETENARAQITLNQANLDRQIENYKKTSGSPVALENNEVEELVNAFRSIPDANSLSNDDLIQALKGSDELSGDNIFSLNSHVLDTVVNNSRESLSQLAESAQQASEANHAYTDSLTEGIVKKQYGEDITKIATDKNGNVNEGVAEMATAAIAEALDNDAKVRDADLQSRYEDIKAYDSDVINDTASLKNYINDDSYGVDMQAQLKEITGLKGLEGVENDKNLALTWAQIQKLQAGEKVDRDTLTVSDGIGKSSVKDSSGNFIFEKVNDEVMRREVANYLHSQAILAKFEEEYGKEGERSETGEKAVKAVDTLQNGDKANAFNEEFGANLSGAVLSAIASGIKDESGNIKKMDLSGLYGDISPEEKKKLEEMSPETLLANLGLAPEHIAALGFGDGKAFAESFQSGLKDYNSEDFWNNQIQMAEKGQKDVANVLEGLQSTGDINELDEEQKKSLDDLISRHEELADIKSKSLHEQLKLLREVQEEEEKTEADNLAEKQKNNYEKLAKLQEKLKNGEITVDDSQLQQVIKDIEDTEIKIKAQIETDLQTDVAQAFGLAEEFEKLQSYVGDNLKITVERAEEIIADGYGAMLENAKHNADGTITIHKETANAFIDSKQAELEADKQAKIEQLTRQKEILNAQLDVLQAKGQALATALATEDEGERNLALAKATMYDAQYQAYTKMLEGELNSDGDQKNKLNTNSEKLYNALGGMQKENATNEQNAAQAGDNAASQHQKNVIDYYNQMQKAVVEYSKAVTDASTGTASLNEVNATSGKSVITNAPKITDIKSSFEALEEQTVEDFLDDIESLIEGMEDTEVQDTIKKLQEDNNKQIESLRAQIGAIDGGIAALKSASSTLDKMQNDWKVKDKGGKKSGKDKKDKDAPEFDSDKLKNLDDEIERYHEIQNALENVSDELEDIRRKKELAHGADKVALIEQETKALEKQAETQKNYIKEIEDYLKKDKDLVSVFGAQFDANGEISNYKALKQAQVDKYNLGLAAAHQMKEDATKKYNASAKDDAAEAAFKAAEKEAENYLKTVENTWEQFKNNLKQYEDTLDLLRDANNELEDIYVTLEKLPEELEFDLKEVFELDKDDLKDLDEEIERYHLINAQLEDIADELEDIQNAKDRAFGKGKIDKINAETKALNKQIDAQQQYRKEIEANLKKDKEAMNAYNAIYDENGNLLNYEELVREQAEAYNKAHELYLAEKNAAVDIYNNQGYGEEEDQEKYDKAIEEAEKKWEESQDAYQDFLDDLQQYEETVDLFEESEKTLRDIENQLYDLQMEKIDYVLQIKLDVSEEQLSYLDYLLDKLDDEAFDVAESMVILGQKAEQSSQKIESYKTALKDVLFVYGLAEESFEDANFAELLKNVSFQEQDIERIREYRDALLEENKTLDELRKTVQDKVIPAFDKLTEKMDTQIEKIEHLQSITASYKNIIDIVGKDYLGISDAFTASLLQSQIDMAVNNLKATKEKLDSMKESRESVQQALENAKEEKDEDLVEYWENTLEEIDGKIRSAESDYLSSWEDALQKAADTFKETIDMALKDFTDSMAGAMGSMDALEAEFDRIQKAKDRYLEGYRQEYELSKLMRSISKSIDETDNTKAKNEYKKLIEEINSIEESGTEISEYKLQTLQKQFELKQAELALEEAKNTKSQVRMTRDNEGNWGYVYTADQQTIDDAMQNYEDKLYALNDLAYKYAEEQQQALIQLQQDFANAISNIQAELGSDEWYAEVARITEFYKEQNSYHLSELGLALDQTGTKFAETSAGTLTGFTDMEGYQAAFNEKIGDPNTEGSLLGQITSAYEQWKTNVETVMNAAGTSTEEYGNLVEEKFEDAEIKSDELAKKTEDMGNQMIEVFDDVVSSIVNWEDEYGSAIDSAIEKNEQMIESLNKLLEEQSKYDQAQKDREEEQKRKEEEEKKKQEDEKKKQEEENKKKEEELAPPIAIPEPTPTPQQPSQSTPSTGDNTSTPTQDPTTDGVLNIGDTVTYVDGYYYEDSWGNGRRGKRGKGKKVTVTDIIPGDRAYPIHVTSTDSAYGWLKKSQLSGFDTGGYTGSWGNEGRLALLHQKELILNQHDTDNMLKIVSYVREISQAIELNALSASNGLNSIIHGAGHFNGGNNTLQQEVTIHAQFPNVTERNEIEKAFDNLINKASQYANRNI